jgi:dipeptidyl aminopeptidase/acylaminoacyl peptidase
LHEVILAEAVGEGYRDAARKMWKGNPDMRFVKWVVFMGALAMCSAGSSLGQEKAESKKAEGAGAKPAAKLKAAGPLEEVFKALSAARGFQQVAISPDGKQVAWVEKLAGKGGTESGNTAIYVAGTGSASAPRQITASEAGVTRAEGNVAWSSDSKSIAFLSDAAKAGQSQLYVVSAAGGTPRKLTGWIGFLAGPRWSPDGKSIAVLFTENATRASGPLVAETPETGVIKDAFFEQRLALVDIASGKARRISPADMYIYEYDWSPDGKTFAVTAAHGNGDNNWWIAELYTLEAATGAMKAIYKPGLQIARPTWSPDGEKIAFVEGLMSDEDSVGGDIFTVTAAGGGASNLTPEMKASASWLEWNANGKILFAEWIEGDSGIATLDPVNGNVETIWRGGEGVTAGLWGTNLSLARDGKTSAGIRNSFAAAPEVWAGPIGEWKQMTHRNASVKPAWGEAKSIHWKNDGYDIQGWLIYPKDFDAGKKYPMVVRVHGGPSWAIQSTWPDSSEYAMALAGAGYFVLQPNPRGSYGQGEAFTRANVKDFGYGDFRDILAGVDEALHVAPIDPERLGLTGWSYGGYMTMWGVTQTNRFKAAMAGAGIANYQSYYGENKIDQWMIPFFGKSAYDDPEVYAKSSPIPFIKNVKTPTLVMVGDSDGECPTPQSYEFWHALKTLGVETQLVVYEHEGHMFANPAHIRERTERTVAWFDRHLK